MYENKLSVYSSEAFFPALRSSANIEVYQSVLSNLVEKSGSTFQPSSQSLAIQREFDVYDLRPLLPPTQHQGLSSDCTAHAIQSAFVAARAANMFHRDSSLSELDVQTALSASMPSRAYISVLYKQMFGPVLPNINMLTQWTYGISDSALCSANMGVPTESHFSYPSIYRASFRSTRVTEDQLEEFSQKLLGESSSLLSQLAERGPYSGWTVTPVVFPEEIKKAQQGIFSTTQSKRDSPAKAKARVELVESFVAALQPVMISLPIYSTFRPFEDDVYHVPSGSSSYQGFNHSVCIVGYDREKSWFIVRDNYGNDLGTKGYWFLPYDTFRWFQLNDAPWVGLGLCTLVPPRSSRVVNRLK